MIDSGRWSTTTEYHTLVCDIPIIITRIYNIATRIQTKKTRMRDRKWQSKNFLRKDFSCQDPAICKRFILKWTLLFLASERTS